MTFETEDKNCLKKEQKEIQLALYASFFLHCSFMTSTKGEGETHT